ncbi:MAG: 3-isopropylmalate dehydrogenase [Anaerolineae bacterium]|nr:3-isopropylmalate dehydrogenase [Anaerolineae bacterium]
MQAKLAALPGDGIGPEIVRQGLKVLNRVAAVFGHDFEVQEAPIGGIAIDQFGTALPDETAELCQASDAVLLGAVGGPKWDDPRAAVRPEQGLLGLRKLLDLFANLRPVKVSPHLLHASPLRPEVVADVDLVVVRELTGGIYFGKRGRYRENGVERAYDTMDYAANEIERVVRFACDLAGRRRKLVSSVDKANVLEVSRLWREVAAGVFSEYPHLETEHVLVDACAMFLVRRPSTFDVLVMGNMFGDILTDEASMIAGSMGMLPSASLGGGKLGLYEPIHGSAPKYTGLDVANPLATVLSAAMLLRHSLGLEEEATAVELAVERVLAEGYRTRDIHSGSAEEVRVGTDAMGTLVAERIGG